MAVSQHGRTTHDRVKSNRGGAAFNVFAAATLVIVAVLSEDNARSSYIAAATMIDTVLGGNIVSAASNPEVESEKLQPLPKGLESWNGQGSSQEHETGKQTAPIKRAGLAEIFLEVDAEDGFFEPDGNQTVANATSAAGTSVVNEEGLTAEEVEARRAHDEYCRAIQAQAKKAAEDIARGKGPPPTTQPVALTGKRMLIAKDGRLLAGMDDPQPLHLPEQTVHGVKIHGQEGLSAPVVVKQAAQPGRYFAPRAVSSSSSSSSSSPLGQTYYAPYLAQGNDDDGLSPATFGARDGSIAVVTAEGVDAALISAARELRQTVYGVTDNSSGPVYPLFYEDQAIDEMTTTFAKPTTQVRVNIRAAFSPTPIPACNYAELPYCTSNMSVCLLEDPVSRPVYCECYYVRAVCMRNLGCYDAMTREDITFCYQELRCGMDQCEGVSGVAGTVLSIAAAVLGAATTVWLAGLQDLPAGGGG